MTIEQAERLRALDQAWRNAYAKGDSDEVRRITALITKEGKGGSTVSR